MRGEVEYRIEPRHAEMAEDIWSTQALRLGFRQIEGLRETDAQTIVDRRGAGYDSIRDLWLRTGLSPAVLERLARADVFRALGLDRRAALWAIRGLQRAGDQDDLPLFRAVTTRLEPDVKLPPLTLGEQVIEDYRHLKLSLKAHPVSFVRAELDRLKVTPCDRLPTMCSGPRLTIAGLVLVRQRPGTASGVIFMTLEDEAAWANVIVWPRVFETFRPTVLGARLVGVTGKLQNESGVIHVVAERLDDLSPLLDRIAEKGADLDPRMQSDEAKRPPPNPRPPRVERLKEFSDALVADRAIQEERPHKAMPKGRNFH